MLLSEWVQTQVDVIAAQQDVLFKPTLPLDEMVENINDRMAVLQKGLAVLLTAQLLIAEQLEANGNAIEIRRN